MLGKQSSGILSPPSPKIEAIPLISATHRINDGELLHLVGSGTELGKKLLRNRVIVRFATGSAALSQNDKIEEMYAWGCFQSQTR